MLRRLRMGFLPDGVAALEESVLLWRRIDGDGGGSWWAGLLQSEPVCRGPYSHVTSESFNLRATSVPRQKRNKI